MIQTNVIKVLVVDDSLVFRQALRVQLAKDKGIEVVGTAINPEDAARKIQELNPDVITLDVEMPGMNGIEFLKRLIPNNPKPVIVVTSLPMQALDALDAGAVDFVRKPGDDFTVNTFISELLVKIKIAAMSKVKSPTIAKIEHTNAKLDRSNPDMIIAIGASTGGTEAILSVIRELPVTTPGIIVVQHMPPVFTKQYAQRLDKICAMRVKEAEPMDRVEPGTVIIAAGEFHLRLKKDYKGYYITSEKGDKVSGHCPSVDVMFHSVADVAKEHAIGVLLTGMGADGAKGLLAMKQAGAYTIGQDKDSCVVYGMPMVAFNIGAVTKQLPLTKITDEIISNLNSRK